MPSGTDQREFGEAKARKLQKNPGKVQMQKCLGVQALLLPWAGPATGGSVDRR